MKSYILLLMIITFAANTIYAQDDNKQLIVPEPYQVLIQDETDISTLEAVYPTTSIPTEVDERCSAFYKALMTEAAGKVYEGLLKGSPLIRNEEKVRNQVVKTLQAIELYGKISGYEQAGAEYISQSYLKVSYLSLHPFNPIFWTFTFYNSPSIGWIVLNFKYTDTF